MNKLFDSVSDYFEYLEPYAPSYNREDYLAELADEILDNDLLKFCGGLSVLDNLSLIKLKGPRLAKISRIITDYSKNLSSYNLDGFVERVNSTLFGGHFYDRLYGLMKGAREVVSEHDDLDCYKTHSWFFSLLKDVFDIYKNNSDDGQFYEKHYKKIFDRDGKICEGLAALCRKAIPIKIEGSHLKNEIEQLRNQIRKFSNENVQ